MSSYRHLHSVDLRREEARSMLERYDDKVPVVVETGKGVPLLAQTKYLVPVDMSVGKFLTLIRRRLELDPAQALFMFVDRWDEEERSVGPILPPVAARMGDIYETHKDATGLLVFLVTLENVFGGK